MAVYTVRDTESGRTLKLKGESPPTEAELEEIFRSAAEPDSGANLLERGKASWLNPQKEDIPEAPYIYQSGDEASLEMFRKAVDPTAQATQDKYGNLVWEGEKGRVYPDKPGFTPRDIPAFMGDATNFLMDAAPLVAGGAATAPLSALRAVPAMTAVGGINATARESADAATGGDFDGGSVAWEALLSGGGEGAVRAGITLLRPVLSKMFGKEAAGVALVKNNGEITDEGLRLLKLAEQTEGFDDALSRELAKMQASGALTEEQAKRYNLFRQYDLDPTRAQVTRTADDFQLQQEAIKRSGQVRSAVETQDGVIQGKFNDMRPQSQGNAAASAQGLKDTVAEADEAISAAYAAARESDNGARVVRVDDFYNAVKGLLPDDARSSGVVQSVWGRLEGNGIMPNNRISLSQAEKVRQHLNSLYDPRNPAGNQVIKTMKDALDESVSRAAPDIFSAPRSAKASLESSLDRASQGRRDLRSGRGIVRDVVENRVDPDNLIAKLRQQSTRATDIDELSSVMPKEQWDGVRASVWDDLLENVFRGADGEMGFQATSRNSLDRYINKWGMNKLSKVLNQDEIGFLTDMQKIMRYREPVPGTALGKGPSAQGMAQAADRIIRRLPVIGDISVDMLKMVINAVGDERLALKALENLSGSTTRSLTNAQAAAIKSALLRRMRPAGGVVSGSAVAESQD